MVGLTDESVCLTLLPKDLQARGAGAFACQPIFSRPLSPELDGAKANPKGTWLLGRRWGILRGFQFLRRERSGRISAGVRSLTVAAPQQTPSCTTPESRTRYLSWEKSVGLK